MPAPGATRTQARPSTGARFAYWLILASLAGAPAPAALAARSEPRSAPLPWRAGSEIGFCVDAAAFPDSAGHVLGVYVRLAPSTLMALAAGRALGGKFSLAVTLRNAFGRLEHKFEQDFVASGGDTAGGYGKVVIFPFRTTPGSKKLQLKMTWIRPGIGGAGRTQTETADGEFKIPLAEPGGNLSDIGFVWPAPRGALGLAAPSDHRNLLPNPERLYGLYADSLRARFIARSPGPGDRPWLWVARVLDAGGRVVSTVEGQGAAGQWLDTLVVTSLAREPAGAYQLEVKAWREGDAGALLRRSPFSIGWEVDTWTANPQDLFDNAHFLLSRDEEEKFEHMPPGDRERVMAEFWRQRDPTPETGENETRETFLKRVDFANRTYGRYGLGKGMFSDMGRTFIRYGEPHEVLKQVIPTRDNTLAEMIRQIAAAEPREMTDVNDRTMGPDMRPFEVWIYEGNIPFPIDADPRNTNQPTIRNRRLVFLFVDEQWVGDYRLRYSTE